MTEEKLTLDEDINLFSNELKRCFSKDDIEDIARKTGFVKQKVKLKHANSFVYVVLWM